MGSGYNLCIIKPNKSAFSETFVQQHIDRLAGNKKVLYGGSFPVYDDQDNYLIKSKLGLLSYLIQKRLFKKQDISVRNKALANYLAANNIDVVYAEYGMVGAMVTKACKQAGVPLIIQYHGADVHHRPTVAQYHDAYQKAFAYASAFIAVSRDMAKQLVKLGAPADKVSFNSCGVDTALFTPIDALTTKPNFLAVGRFIAKKDPLATIEAFKIVTEKLPDAHLWMVGQGPLLDAAKQKVTELQLNDKITFMGVLPSAQIIELMKQMCCFVQHSVTAADGDMEGTPVTVLEAGAMGLPVVSTAHAGIKDAVINGETGFLVAEHDVQAMADKMITIATNPQLAAQMGKAGRQHMLNSYDLDKRIATIDGIIQKALT